VHDLKDEVGADPRFSVGIGVQEVHSKAASSALADARNGWRELADGACHVVFDPVEDLLHK
jgi:hypothetical protein